MISRDRFRDAAYSTLMAEGQAHIIVTIDTKEPIELGDFVSAFTSLSAQYIKYMSESHPSISGEAKVFVKEIRAGSIVADLIPFVTLLGGGSIIPALQQIDIIVDFVQKYGAKIKLYFGGGAGVETATSNDLNDFLGAVSAIAHDNNGSAKIEAAYFENGKTQIRAGITFTSQDARYAVNRIAEQRVRLEGERREARDAGACVNGVHTNQCKNVAFR